MSKEFRPWPAFNPMRDLLPNCRPALVLAPMQDVTDLPFLRVLARRSRPDWFVTEYFRVHAQSRPEPHILRTIEHNDTGRPIFAQLIGQDLPHLIRTARELEPLPIAGIDLNLGCPAPIVCRKNAGGGLLRDPDQLDSLLGGLREAIHGRFTVKTRIGYHDPAEFPRLLECFAKHAIDGLTIHGRTVEERYQTPVHPDCVRLASETLPCPVIANGNIVDVETAAAYHQQCQPAGLMVGRGAIRNPWIFDQIAAHWEGRPTAQATHRQLLDYITDLYEESARSRDDFNPKAHVQAMKRVLAYISHGLADEAFEFEIRRATTEQGFFATCRQHLDHDTPLPARPPADSKLFCGFSALLTAGSAETRKN